MIQLLFGGFCSPFTFELLSRDSADRTGCFAGAALKTCISVDNVLAISLRNSVCRAFACTCSASYTLIRDNVCHDRILLIIYVLDLVGNLLSIVIQNGGLDKCEIHFRVYFCRDMG